MAPSFYIFNHQGKGKAYLNALLDAGWTHSTSMYRAKVVLADSDVTPIRIEHLREFHDAGSKVFVFPHAARVSIAYDFPGVTPFEGTVAQFVSSETHQKVLEIIGYPKPVHSVGWSYCPILPFSPTQEIRKVLFAPIHANGNNWLSQTDKDLNRRAMETLLRSKKTYKFELQVRFLNSLDACGLKRVEGVRYFRGEPNQSFNMIDKADLIVSHQTFAYIAVARGKPTLMIGEDLVPRMGNAEQNLCLAKSWDNYKHLVMYPYDILKYNNAHEAMEEVSHLNPLVEEWKKSMIGRAFNPGKFVGLLTSYLQEDVPVLSGV